MVTASMSAYTAGSCCHNTPSWTQGLLLFFSLGFCQAQTAFLADLGTIEPFVKPTVANRGAKKIDSQLKMDKQINTVEGKSFFPA